MLLAAYAALKDKFGASRLTVAMAGQSIVQIGWDVVEATAQSFVNGVSGSVDLVLWLAKVLPSAGTKAWGVLAFAGFVYVLHHITADRSRRARTIAG